MAIEIFENSIVFTNGSSTYILKEETGGFSLTGKLSTSNINYLFMGNSYGFVSGGSPFINSIDGFPFASDAVTTVSAGTLTLVRGTAAGQSSATHGYTSGGSDPLAPNSNTVDRFPFSTTTTATDVGDLTTGRRRPAGNSSSTAGYTSGGGNPSSIDTLGKFSFASDTTHSNIGTLSAARVGLAGQSSVDNGFTSGGQNPSPGISNVIDKFPFATDTNASDVGDLTVSRYDVTGNSSLTHGYTSGGYSGSPFPSPGVNVIDKFPFASNVNASDVGDINAGLNSEAAGMSGQSSNSFGYISGGLRGPAFGSLSSATTISRFPFASDSNGFDIGNLGVAKQYTTGQQV
jgi:hypothetical protein